MASSRTTLMVLLLLAACLCATVSANRVVPTSMKLDLGRPLDLELGNSRKLTVGLTLDLSKLEAGLPVIVIVEKAVFKLVGGKVSKVLYLNVVLPVDKPLAITITLELLGIKKDVVVPLKVLDPALGEITGVVKEVKGVLVLVPRVGKGVFKALSVANGLGKLIATLLP